MDQRVQGGLLSLFEDKDPGLTNLLRKRTIDLTRGQIKESLQRTRVTVDFPQLPPTAAPGLYPPTCEPTHTRTGSPYTHRHLRGFVLLGEKRKARRWRDLLLGVCEKMRRRHQEEFDDKVLGLRGRKRAYFSRTPEDLVVPHALGGNDIFAEFNLSANSMVSVSTKVMALFGYGPEDLSFEVE